MKFVSTRDPELSVTFKQALFQGLAPDGGLFIPKEFTPLPKSILNHLHKLTIHELAEAIMAHFIDDIPKNDLQKIVNQTLNFPIPLVYLSKHTYLLEVFHGPTLAFKDIGARFMACLLAYYSQAKQEDLSILVATSGDTGSAIANAFYKMPNIDVYILYPSQKISPLQELQMTTLGHNIHPIEVQGTFDDCQKLVKAALNDPGLREHHSFTTANSINIARLLPQIIYHSWGVCQLLHKKLTTPPVLVVPSGNFGNLVSAVYAKSLGVPIDSFIAATNINNIVPEYIATGQFTPKASQKSFSNAMDVGNPSNFERLSAFFHNDVKRVRDWITGISITDAKTLAEISNTYAKTDYILDPHTAVGVAAAKTLRYHAPIIITATAHPAKFPEVIAEAIQQTAPIPNSLAAALKGKKQSTLIAAKYPALVNVLCHR